MLSRELIEKIVTEILPDFISLIDRYIEKMAHEGSILRREYAFMLVEQEYKTHPGRYYAEFLEAGIPAHDISEILAELFRRARLHSGN